MFKRDKKSVAEVPTKVKMPDVVRDGEHWDQHVGNVLKELQRLYTERIRPVEVKYEYDTYNPSWFSETLKQKKPFITFLGPFSAGKSSFINYLMQRDYLHTGPQPVTDKFTVIMHGEEVRNITGRVLMADANQPFRELNKFGNAFADCFAGVVAPHPILRSVTLIDTPGVLEASGDVHARRYDYVTVCRWFVEKSDLVFFLFDPTKLDAGNELRQLFTNALRGHESKIRIVLNKADTVRPQELMRVYGSLFWNLSNLIVTTEPPRVYVSSFWDKPYRPGTDHKLFAEEKEDLLYELIESVPTQSLDQRVASVICRTTNVLTFVLMIATYLSRLPVVFGKSKAKRDYYAQYNALVADFAARHHLSPEDFPPVDALRAFLLRVDSSRMYDLNRLAKKRWVEDLKRTLEEDLSALLQPIREHAIMDPRDRKNAILLQRAYEYEVQAEQKHAQQMAEQLAPSPYGFSTTSLRDATPSGAYDLTPNDSASQVGQAQIVQAMQAMLQMQQMQMNANAQSSVGGLHSSLACSVTPSSLAPDATSQLATMQIMLQQMQQQLQSGQ